MKKLCIVLFLLCTFTFALTEIATTSDTIQLHCSTPEITTKTSSLMLNGIPTIAISAADALYPIEEGTPSIPYFSSSLIIPYGKEVDTVLFLSTSSFEKKLSHPIAYGMALWNTPQNQRETIIQTEAYETQHQAPTAKVVSAQRNHGVQIVSIAHFPLQYSGVHNSLMVHDSYTVQIILKDVVSRGNTTCFPNRLQSTTYLNRDALLTYPDESQRSEEYDWLMISDIFITTSAAAVKLKQHREAQGLRCKIVDVAQVGITPKEIRAFIKEEYLNHGIKYVLLVGDETTIPPFRIDTYTAGGGIWDSITTDLPYQCLDDDDWETKYYEEPYFGDYIAELQIGRILATDIHQFSNQSEKIITYEKLDSNETSLGRMLGVGEKLDDINWGRDFIINVHKKIPELIEKELLCDKDTIWNDRDLYQRTNSNSHTIINHDGHASPRTILKLTNAAGLINEVPLFIKSQGCKPAYYHQEDITITEKLTLAPHGFFAATLNTNYGWYAGAGNGPSQKLHEFFWQAHFEEGIKTFSGMTEYSHRKCLEHKSFDVGFLWDMFSSNYFGDPATEYRSPKGAIPITEESKTPPSQGITVSYEIDRIRYTLPQSSNHIVSLFTAQGRQLIHKRVKSTTLSHSLSLKSSAMANGIYFLRIKSNHSQTTLPIIVR